MLIDNVEFWRQFRLKSTFSKLKPTVDSLERNCSLILLFAMNWTFEDHRGLFWCRLSSIPRNSSFSQIDNISNISMQISETFVVLQSTNYMYYLYYMLQILHGNKKHFQSLFILSVIIPELDLMANELLISNCQLCIVHTYSVYWEWLSKSETLLLKISWLCGWIEG